MKDFSNLLLTSELEKIMVSYNTPVNLITGLIFNQRLMIRTIEFYTNSRYLNGNKDELGRDKPFYNIVNGMCDVENAATDIDTKDCVWTADDGQHYAEAFLLTKDIQQWMKRSNFAKTLNDMRDTRTRYGSLLVKKVEETGADGEKVLSIQVPEWKNVITDQVNILGRPIIECHYMTPIEIMRKNKVWENIKEALNNSPGIGYTVSVPVYEIHGWFPLSFYRQIEHQKSDKKNPYVATDVDKETFTYQLYYMAGQRQYSNLVSQIDLASQINLGKLVPLYWENNAEQCYKYLSRKRRAGRAFGIGVVEEGEEAQVWSNDAVIKQFRAMEYTTKVVGQSASKKLKGRNMLNEVEDGQILEHEDNKPITTLALLPSGGLQQYQALLGQWFNQFERATSAYSAQRGESPSSRTAAKLQAAVLQQSGSVMQTIQEEFGIFLTEVLTEWVMPWLGKQLNAAHILAHEFSLDELKQIDRNFSIHTANAMAKDAILSGRIVSAKDYEKFMQSADEMIKQTKATRFLDLPDNYYKKAIAHGSFNITGEAKDKQGAIDSLLGIMKIYQGDPNLINDPVLTALLMQIVELSGAGISPVTLIAAIQEKARLAAEAAKNNPQQPAEKVSQSISYKDLPPDGQRQMAAKVGIDINPEPMDVPEEEQEPAPVAPVA